MITLLLPDDTGDLPIVLLTLHAQMKGSNSAVTSLRSLIHVQMKGSNSAVTSLRSLILQKRSGPRSHLDDLLLFLFCFEHFFLFLTVIAFFLVYFLV